MQLVVYKLDLKSLTLRVVPLYESMLAYNYWLRQTVPEVYHHGVCITMLPQEKEISFPWLRRRKAVHAHLFPL